MNSILKFSAKIISAIVIFSAVAGIYQGYKEYKMPKVQLEIAMGASDFSMPPNLDEIFDQVKGEDRAILDKNYSLVAKYNPLNKITYAGLHNHGDKVATDIKIKFPGARIMTVKEDGKNRVTIQGKTDVIIDKLLPDASVYFVVWGITSVSEKNVGTVSGVHSEGRIEISESEEVYRNVNFVFQKSDFLFGIAFCVLFISLAYLIKNQMFSN